MVWVGDPRLAAGQPSKLLGSLWAAKTSTAHAPSPWSSRSQAHSRSLAPAVHESTEAAPSTALSPSTSRPSHPKGLQRRTSSRDGFPSSPQVRSGGTFVGDGRASDGRQPGWRAVDHAALWICGQARSGGVALSTKSGRARCGDAGSARLTTSSTSLGRLGLRPTRPHVPQPRRLLARVYRPRARHAETSIDSK